MDYNDYVRVGQIATCREEGLPGRRFMFMKNRVSIVIRLFLILTLSIGSFIFLSFQVNTRVYALGSSPGTLDLSFDTDGIVITDFNASTDMSRSILIQDDGKIVVAGMSHSNDTNSDFALARYNSDGSLDTTFDTDGIVTTDFTSDWGSNSDQIYDIAYQNWDGKIVAVGVTQVQGSSSFAVARYNSDGSLDTNFGINGKVTPSFSNAYSVVVQGDGKIIVAGCTTSYFVLVRLNENGLLDTTFGDGGKVITDFNGIGVSGGYIALLPNEKILLVGSRSQYYQNVDFVIARYNHDGSLDATFGGSGKVITDAFKDDAFANSVAIQLDGKILISGDSHISGESYGVLARFNLDGSLDTNFGTDGRVITNHDGIGTVVAIQPNEKIVVGGRYSGGIDNDFTLTRYNVDGSPDATFGTNGETTTDLGGADQVFSIAVQQNGRILIAGFTDALGIEDDFVVGRYFGDEIHYVKSNATGVNNGSSWADAYTDLQFALSVASNGDEVWVMAGTYKPTSGTDRTKSFNLKTGVAIYGGFNGTETMRQQRNFIKNVTILSGDIGVIGDNDDNSFHVVNGGDTDNTAILNGFTITEGNAKDAIPDPWGGGMHILGGNPRLTNLVFTANLAESGGGIALDSSNSILTNIIFRDNLANFSGGVLVVAGMPTFKSVTFNGNNADFNGGGMGISNSNPSLENVTFYGNRANKGAGIYIYGNPTLKNVTFSGNIAGNSGGGIYNDSSTPTIINSILWNNVGGEIENYDANTPIVSYSIVQGGYVGTGNLEADPILGVLQGNGGFTQTMALYSSSPAINAGNDAECSNIDQRGVIRPQGSHCDIGAYELELFTKTLKSISFQDGWILESSETSNTGGTMNSSATLLYVGDDAQDKQYKSILSFDTSSLPNNAKIKSVKLKIKVQGFVGGNMFTPTKTLGNLLVDISKTGFGANANLVVADFQSAASRNAVGVLGSASTAWQTITLKSVAYDFINLAGKTQFRLHFQKDDNDDLGNDYLKIFSGNAPASSRPQLIVEYSE